MIQCWIAYILTLNSRFPVFKGIDDVDVVCDQEEEEYSGVKDEIFHYLFPFKSYEAGQDWMTQLLWK